MATFNRRSFLIQGSTVLAAAGAATALPGFLTTPAGADVAKDHPAGKGETLGATSGSLDEPLVAHILDLTTGEIALFQGENEFVLHDPQLARKLAGAAR
jgi:hypothetical protein